MVSTVVAPLLERSIELAEIDDRLASLHDGSSTGLLIEGPPGIGKTRLLAEAQDRAAEAGVPALGHHPSPVGVVGNEFSTLHGLYWLTVNLAGSGPVMLTIDDLHWCDLPSLRFIAYLVARLEGSGILVLGSTRAGEAASSAARDVIGRLALDPAVRLLTPLPLTVSATTTIVQDRLGDSSERGFCEVCQELTGGNPFLLSELLTALADEQVMPTAAAIEHVRRMTPEVVSRSVLLRLSTLPGPSLSIARAVAVLGASPTPGRVAALAAVEPDVAVDCLQRLVEANILRDEDAPLAFVHPIVHAAVYEDLSALARGRWHERAAEILAEQFAAPAELTGHLLATAPAANRRTVARLREAAIDALGRGAAETAVACLRRALQEPPGDDSERVTVLTELGRAEALIDPGPSCRHLQEALQAVREPALSAPIALALGSVQAFHGRFSDSVHTLDCALTALEPGPTDLRSSLQAELLNAAHWDAATRPRAAPMLAELERRFSEGQNLDARLHAYLAFSSLERGESRDQTLIHARLALRSAPERSLEMTATRQVVTALAVCEELGEAQVLCRAWLLEGQWQGHVLAAALASSTIAITELLGGRISDALAHARQSLAPPPQVWTPPFGMAWLVEALTERGAIDDARRELAERNLDGALPQTLPFALLLLCRGRAHGAAGENDRALADLLAAGDVAEALGIANPALLPWRSNAALALLALERNAEAAELAEEELARARRWGGKRAFGVALRAAGLIHAGSVGIETLREAETVLANSTAPLEHARVLIDLGAALRRSGERAQAREPLRHGLDLAHRLGGLALAAQARRELQIAGARPRRDALRGRDALTASELRVARMAAAGSTNRQIAQALFVTQRTVELHLSSSHTKLGITSRRHLAAALNHDLHPDDYPPRDH